MGSVKIGVEFKGNPIPYLGEVSPSESLAGVIEDVCRNFKLKDPKQFSLKVSDTEEYVTDETFRSVLRVGIVFTLVRSADLVAQELLQGLKDSNNKWQSKGFRNMYSEADSLPVSNILVSKEGERLMHECVTTCPVHDDDGVSAVAYAIACICNLLRYGLVHVDFFLRDRAFLDRVISGAQSSKNDKFRGFSLQFLAYYVKQRKEGLQHVLEAIKEDKIINYLKVLEQSQTKESALALLNVILQAYHDNDTPAARDQATRLFASLRQKGVFPLLYLKDGREGDKKEKISRQYKHELYAFQQLWLRQFYFRAQSSEVDQTGWAYILKVIPTFEKATDGIDIESPVDKCTLLGFTDPEHPEGEFSAYPGVLPLEILAMWARTDEEGFRSAVTEQIAVSEEYRCPFILLVKHISVAILDLLQVHIPPNPSGVNFMPLFLSNDPEESFHKMMAVCIQHTLRIWREANAKTIDLDKIMRIVSEQWRELLADDGEILETDPRHRARETLDYFRDYLAKTTYKSFFDIHRRTLHQAEKKQLRTSAVHELRVLLHAKVEDLVKRSYLARMRHGAWFSLPGKSKKKEKIKIVLSQNGKTLYWGETPEDNALPPKSCDAEDLKQVEGMDSLKDKYIKYKNQNAFFFGFFAPEMEELFVLQAATEAEADLWYNGLRLLLGRPTDGPIVETEKERLLELLLRVHLQTIQGITLPATIPEVPPLPPNFDFAYEYTDDSTTFA